MQFSCESCKAHLQIADEKVRGKRLIVRCRRCGAKIALADPALANSSPRLVASSSTPGPMRIVPQPAPGPKRQHTDTESTRAMDSDVLERALQASKAAQEGPQNGAPATEKLHFPPPVPSLDGPIWFAMLRGKQTGPLTREELKARAHDGEIGPRTYLWREGMDAWQRALEVADLTEMFPRLPAPAPPVPAPLPAAAPAQAAVAAGPGDRTTIEQAPAAERPPLADVFREPPLAPAPKDALDLARWATSESPEQQEPSPALAAPPVQQEPAPAPVPRNAPMFESAAPTERGPFMVFLGLMALAAAAIVLWVVLAAGPEKDEPRTEVRSQGNHPAAAPQAAQPAEPADPRPGVPSPQEQAAPTGLTADQVHRKLDENKPALQGCVDDALRRDPHLKVGKIHVATTIAPNGQVTAAKIDQRSVDESALGACLKGATKKIVFPQFAGAAFEVDIPIVVPAGE